MRGFSGDVGGREAEEREEKKQRRVADGFVFFSDFFRFYQRLERIWYIVPKGEEVQERLEAGRIKYGGGRTRLDSKSIHRLLEGGFLPRFR